MIYNKHTNFEESIEAVRCLSDKHLPAPVVVVLTRQSTNFHLVNERVCANNGIALGRLLYLHLQAPRRFATARQTHDHDHLS